jgi:hypothetical protein
MLPNQRLRDAALLLPIVAVLLMLPVVLSLVSGDRWFAGLPSLPTFIFSAWLLLIGAGAWLARRLMHDGSDDDGAGPGAGRGRNWPGR